MSHDHEGACCAGCAEGRACESDCPDHEKHVEQMAFLLRTVLQGSANFMELRRGCDDNPAFRYEVPAYFDGKPWEFDFTGSNIEKTLGFGGSPPHGFRPVIDNISIRSGIDGVAYVPVRFEYGWVPYEVTSVPFGADLRKRRVFAGFVTNAQFNEVGGVAGGLRVPRDPQSGRWARLYLEIGTPVGPLLAPVKLTIDAKWVRTEHCFPPNVQRLSQLDSL